MNLEDSTLSFPSTMENSYKLEWIYLSYIFCFLGSFSNKPTLLRLTPGVVELTGDVYKRV